ncbi:RHS repeat domain-containing protein [Runella sp.]|uniref:RHS repeat domain-containing protein n=1 Tax=Runella sp. TaxID=1960881 RepID=UPI003D14DFF1
MGAPSVITQENHYSGFGLSLQGIDFQNTSPDLYRYSQNEQQNDFGLNLYDFGARFSDPTIGNRFWQIDPLAEIARRFSPYLYANANPMRFVDPDGMSSQQIQDFEGNMFSINEGDMVSIYKAPEGADGGDEKQKQGYYPSGVMRPASQQNAVIKPTEPKEFGAHFTPEEKAAQLGVDIFGFVEGGFGLFKIVKWAKSLFKLSDEIAGAAKEGFRVFSGTEKAWQSGATPNSIYTYLSSDGKAVSNYIYNAEGKVIYQVDFGKHGKFLSGHGHEMTTPGNLGSGHTNHIPWNQVPPEYLKIPNGVQYSTLPGQ